MIPCVQSSLLLPDVRYVYVLADLLPPSAQTRSFAVPVWGAMFVVVVIRRVNKCSMEQKNGGCRKKGRERDKRNGGCRMKVVRETKEMGLSE